MTFLLHIKLYKTNGLRWFLRRCDGRPRPVRDDARAVRREACACSSMRESQLPRRRIHRPSKEDFSCIAPSLRSDSDFCYFDTLPGWMRQVSGVLLVCEWSFGVWRERLHFGYGFGSIWTGAGNWSAFSCEDDGVGGGCSDSSESFGGCAGEPE